MRYLNTDPYFINGQHRITVHIIGAGGNGSLILTKLAQLHIALNYLDHPGFFVRMYDDQEVEKWNPGRQMFTTNDIGAYKAERLIEKVNMAYGFDWEAYNRKFKADDAKANVLMVCVDNLKTRKQVLKAFYSDKTSTWQHTLIPYYLIDVGNGRDFGQVILCDKDHKLPNLFDIYPDIEQMDTREIQGDGCSYQDKLNEQDLIVNHWVSILTYHLMRDMIMEKRIDYHGMLFNSSDFNINKMKISDAHKFKRSKDLVSKS